MRFRAVPLLFLAITANAGAGELTVGIEIPSLQVAEYHRPYVAVWIQGKEPGKTVNLAVWYQQKKGGGTDPAKADEGVKWLADLRQWWRRSGREAQLPIDGVSGATRPAGIHTVKATDRSGPMAGLAAGEYTLMVEVAREVGGHEVVRIPFAWPPQKPTHGEARGTTELGAVTLDLAP
ncbi:DUF2271 domain-containing protein [Tahibacter amnicola]|uniref:DUF2271 domain-containing protein n=1 Tax=Tahibacter amnicola TaxID=2976241 RepID=A0ABY6BC83_9GAMM|nr:DUF2271 domain-containing protein [Tahibacter amnicola]UXI67162.1 DUF2271 domain-containing protein [Tahibacter amnicola]